MALPGSSLSGEPPLWRSTKLPALRRGITIKTRRLHYVSWVATTIFSFRPKKGT